ncbi:MAG TPA: Chromate resistance protein ChrB [Nitrososphaerales archaeon]|nr:Chromate resistance protein ChrB [Nitrososphaerales archaeon]
MRRSGANEWIIVAYDLPNEPSKLRVRAWRNFKKLGALYPPVSLCILPNTQQVRKDIGRFRSDFRKHGTILVMDASALEVPDEDVLARMFQEDRRKQYEEIYEECQEFLDEITENIENKKVTYEETDELEQTLEALEKWYGNVQEKGYGRDEDASKVERVLSRCKKALASFAEKAQPVGINK